MPIDHGFTEEECERIAQLIEHKDGLYSQEDKALIAKFDALPIEQKFYRNAEQIEEYKRQWKKERDERTRQHWEQWEKEQGVTVAEREEIIRKNRQAMEDEPLPDEDPKCSIEKGSLSNEESQEYTEEDLEWLEQEISLNAKFFLQKK
ncbi:hypothetical protein DdX_12601 [Ditylenchus destructor]|uniref:Uncharacterized protein n=1 Tax=Ditylenchus destructor TaxID=166010 RepID=A0AAD4N095_9BILA|nr:hypothetical protein DdX_12601 [Ditylenchus destructor]